VRSVVAVVTAYLLSGFSAPILLALRRTDLMPVFAWALILERRAELAIIATAALVVCWRRQTEPGFWLLASGGSIVALAWGELGRTVTESRAHLLPLLAVVPTAAALAAIQRRRDARAPSFAASVFVGTVTLAAGLALLPVRHQPRANRLGLISGRPNSMTVEDYSSHPLKDDYPRATIRNNSLGYRDMEPGPSLAGRERVLLVGDSYVWGDGIPAGEDTLPALLRDHLERLAPVQYDVTSAAYPGLGAYGYRRTLEGMIPTVGPSLILVGFLGEPDLDPLDAQALRELLPRARWLARMVLNLRVLQDLHEASVAALDDPRWRALGAARARELFEALSQFAHGPGHRALLLCYGGDGPRVPGLDTIDLPPAWRYQNRRSELWYAKDSHPKPALNRLLAGWLASEIVHPGSAQRAGPAVLAGAGPANSATAPANPVIPPGQEAVIREMLGGSSGIAQCRLTSAAVQRTRIEASYECGGGETRTASLRHLSTASRGALRTRHFALTSAGAVPQRFLDELASRIRARESDFHWIVPQPTSAVSGAAVPRSSPWRTAGAVVPGSSFLRMTAFVAGALLLMGLTWRRRPSPSRTSASSEVPP
jgi:hypothetical protein